MKQPFLPIPKLLEDILPKPPQLIGSILDSAPVRALINTMIRDIAEVERISALAGGGVGVAVRLKGEKEPATVTLRHAAFDEAASSVRLTGLSSDRPWLDGLLRNFAEGRDIPLPADLLPPAMIVIRPLLGTLLP